MKYLILLLVLSSCATTYKDFKGAKPGEAAAIGSVELTFNGRNLGDKCAVCFNSVNGPCQKLTPEGFVFAALPLGRNSIRRVQCQDSSPHHYNIEGATFELKEGSNYFGHARIAWKAKGGFKASSLFGLVGALADESSNDGSIRMSVSAEGWRGVVQTFQRQTGSAERVRSNLVREGR